MLSREGGGGCRSRLQRERFAFIDVMARWLREHGDWPQQRQADGDELFSVLGGVGWTQNKLAEDMKNWREGNTVDDEVKAYGNQLFGEGWLVSPGVGAGST